jgi:hypothetical protein
MTQHGQTGSTQLWKCVVGKSVFIRLFFIIHISQKKHCNYVSCSFIRCNFLGHITQMHGPHHQESNIDSAPSQQCTQNIFTIKETWKPLTHTLKEQNKTSSKFKSWPKDSVLLYLMMLYHWVDSSHSFQIQWSWNIRNRLLSVMNHMNRIWSYALQILKICKILTWLSSAHGS